MGVVGLIVAMLVNIFIRSDTLSMVISVDRRADLFAGLTAYDTQKIKSIYFQVAGHRFPRQGRDPGRADALSRLHQHVPVPAEPAGQPRIAPPEGSQGQERPGGDAGPFPLGARSAAERRPTRKSSRPGRSPRFGPGAASSETSRESWSEPLRPYSNQASPSSSAGISCGVREAARPLPCRLTAARFEVAAPAR